jgi:UDP-glucose 4-epimerase
MSGIIVVTGASGFIGRRLVARLVADGRSVRALVRDPSALEAGPGLEVVRWELGAPAPLDGAAAVIHGAAYRPPRFGDPGEAGNCMTHNALGTLSLVEAAAEASVGRFVYLSAGNVYVPRGRPSTEDDPIWPSHRAPYYLGSKICGEFFVSAAADAGRIEAVRLRPSAVYGPGMPPGLVPTFLAGLRAGTGITVADGGVYAADLVHVDDVVSAIVASLSPPANGAYNIGSGATVTALQIAEVACDLLGIEREVIDVLPPRKDPPGFAALDITRAKAELGFEPRPFRTGLRQTIGLER